MKNIKSFIVLFGLVCVVVHAADYGVVAEYLAGEDIRSIGINSDRNEFVALSLDGRNSGINKFGIMIEPESPCITPIRPSKIYQSPEEDEYATYVQYGTQDASKNHFYVQGYTGALFQTENPKAIFAANKVMSNNRVACLECTDVLNEESRIFISHHKLNLSYNVTLTTLKGDQNAEYNVSPKYSKGYWPSSIISNQVEKVVAASCVGNLALAVWNIETQQCTAEMSYFNSQFFTGQVILDPHTKTYLLTAQGCIWRCNLQDNTFKRVVADTLVKRVVANTTASICLVDETTLMVGDINGKLHWFDTSSFKKIGTLELDSKISINVLQKISEREFLAGASNGFVYQLQTKN